MIIIIIMIIIINNKKRTCKIVDFAVPADLARELKKKTLEHAGDNYTNCNWCFWYSN